MRKINYLLLSFCCLLCCLWSCQNKTDNVLTLMDTENNPSKTVYAEKAKRINYRTTVYSSGKIMAKEATKLSFRTGGQIKELNVKAGQFVRKGQVLATLDAAAIEVALQQASLTNDQAAISIQNVELLLKKANRDYQNTLGLYRDSVATLEQLEDAELQVESVTNQLAAAKQSQLLSEQQQNAVQVNQQHTTILAPANGTILKKFAAAQETVGGGTPIFLFAGSQKSKVIEVNITDKDIIHLQIGDTAKVYFDAYPSETFLGLVQVIDQIADPVLNTFKVEIGLRPTKLKLFDGFIGQVAITTGKARPLISIPIDALVNADGKKGTVFTLKKGKVKNTTISIFKIENENLLVANGLIENQSVIVSGTGNINPKESVVVRR